MNKRLVLGITLIVLSLVALGLWRVTSRGVEGSATVQTGEVKVILTDEGFSPQSIGIRKGTTVTFTTTTGKFFWPASDLHPSHGIFPEFDPKKPIPATQSWSFTFNKVGSWDYHDHLSPYYVGTITVVE